MVAGGEKTANSGGVLFAGDIPRAGLVAHELKAPLATIRQLSLELQDETLSEQERTMIAQQIETVSERALRLSSDLALSERAQTTLFSITSLDSGALCSGVIRDMEPVYRAYERRIELRLSRRTHLMAGNHDLLHRILVNFVDNALHYTDEKSVVQLYTELRQKEARLRLGVRDYGAMMPLNVWRAIKKGEAPSVHQGRSHSSGLGLVIAHRFAEATGGKIGAIRHRNGASFYIDVPLSRQVSLL